MHTADMLPSHLAWCHPPMYYMTLSESERHHRLVTNSQTTVFRAFLCMPAQELPGRLWEGKECLLLAVGALAAACLLELLGGDQGGSSSDGGGLAGRTVAALVEAAGKKKAAYRRAALEQMEAGAVDACFVSLRRVGRWSLAKALACAFVYVCVGGWGGGATSLTMLKVRARKRRPQSGDSEVVGGAPLLLLALEAIPWWDRGMLPLAPLTIL